MTIIEALDITINGLEKISVPISQADTIAKPLWESVGNLKAIKDALLNNEPKEEGGDPESAET